MSKIRAFIAIEIPGEIRTKISELQSSLKRLGGRISWTKPKNIHLTLKFLGDTDESLIDEIAEELKKMAASFSQFQIHVNGIGAFPNFKRPRVIWVGTNSENENLSKIAFEIENRMEKLDFKKETRKFSGHLTLGRIKDPTGIQPIIDRLQQNKDFHAGSFPVKELFLIKSQLHPTGSIYTILKKVNLRESQPF